MSDQGDPRVQNLTAEDVSRGLAAGTMLLVDVRELNEAYNHFFFHYNATPLLVVETSQFDLTWGAEALEDGTPIEFDTALEQEVLKAYNRRLIAKAR